MCQCVKGPALGASILLIVWGLVTFFMGNFDLVMVSHVSEKFPKICDPYSEKKSGNPRLIRENFCEHRDKMVNAAALSIFTTIVQIIIAAAMMAFLGRRWPIWLGFIVCLTILNLVSVSLLASGVADDRVVCRSMLAGLTGYTGQNMKWENFAKNCQGYMAILQIYYYSNEAEITFFEKDTSTPNYAFSGYRTAEQAVRLHKAFFAILIVNFILLIAASITVPLTYKCRTDNNVGNNVEGQRTQH